MASSEHTTDEISSDVGDDDRGEVSIEELGAELETLRAEVDALREENKRLHEELEDVRANECECADRIEWRDDGQQIESLWIDGVPIGNAIAKRKEEIEQLEADVEEAISEETLADSSESIDDEWTIAEKAIAIGPDEFLDSASEKRAVTILENYSGWSSTAQAGRVIRTRSDKLRKLLGAERGENLAWKQVYRACEKLEILTDEYVEWDNEQKILVLSEPLPSMADDEY
jgi:outer membrane murein-binding lipoprotein Lpp